MINKVVMASCELWTERDQIFHPAFHSIIKIKDYRLHFCKYRQGKTTYAMSIIWVLKSLTERTLLTSPVYTVISRRPCSFDFIILIIIIIEYCYVRFHDTKIHLHSMLSVWTKNVWLKCKQVIIVPNEVPWLFEQC